jgi:oligoendopeptidase F
MVATTPVPNRTFVPASLDPADFAQLQPLFQRLLDRPIDGPADLERWLADFSELTAAVDEYGSRRYVEKSCHTEDPAIEKAYLHYVENIEPNVKPLHFALQKKYLQSPHRASLESDRHAILGRKWQADVELFREANVPLETEVTKLVTDYDKICGAMTVTIDGKEYTLPQAGRFLEEPDRPLRQRSWEAVANRRLQDRDKCEEIFDRVLALRQTIAGNADVPDYRAYAWKAYKRFDYTPADCESFADAVAETCVPVVDALHRQRQADLSLDRLRPWDLSVDPRNRPALRPFQPDDVGGFIDKTRTIIGRLSPALAGEFESLRTHGNLDLDSRKGKQPGGYQMSLEESKQPFIFMNAAGMQGDVETLLHEGGHAFHFIAAAAAEPLVFLRSAPMEFCEVASMSMELLGSEHFDAFYPDAADAARAKRTLLEGIIELLPWIATIDSFQHWIYTHPNHTRDERTAHWLSLSDRFGAKVDWAGYEPVRASNWLRQLHLFHAPFYYIEYGIAQLGALQLWLKAKEDPRKALANYRAALKLAGTRPLPDLFAAAGLRFDFSAATLRPLMQAVREELDSLPR